jgi:aminoglycoside 3-N-acetyltransferase
MGTRPQVLSPPIGRGWLIRDLVALGVEQGQTLLVHASLRSIGWVEGGARTIVAALRDAVGATGNIVMSTGTEENSQTSRAHRARIAGMTEKQVRAYLRNMPPYDAGSTPTGMGAIAEELRTTDGAVRSGHPQSSFVAIGPDADFLMADHRLESHLGEDSPLAKLHKLDALVLMVGVGYKACTAIHLAEYRYTPNPPMRTYTCVVATGGRRHWTAYRDVVLDDHQFDIVGTHIEERITPRLGRLGDAVCRLLPLSDIVDCAAEWMRINRC